MPRRAHASRSGLPRVAIVGLGIGRLLARQLLAHPAAAQIVALCSSHRDRVNRVADELGVKGRYTDFQTMLVREAPDAVLVATPNDLHEPMAVAALESGSHVMCEKPLAHTLASARRIAAAAKRM